MARSGEGSFSYRWKHDARRKAASAAIRRLILRRQVQVVTRHEQLLDSIIPQIREQGEIDPAVLAPGYNALTSLKLFDAPDLLTRNGIDAAAIAGIARRHPRIVLILSALQIGGAEKYAADLTRHLLRQQPQSLMVLVTDQTAAEAAAWRGLSILSPLGNATVVFWRDICRGEGWRDATNLAKMLNYAQPQELIVVNTALGFEAVARHGRRLAHLSRITCAYFGLGVDGLTAPFSVRYPRLTWPHAVSLTDSGHVARILAQRYGRIPGPGIRLLPPRIESVAADCFARRLAKRTARAEAASRRLRWVWISRIERWKGTAILAGLAAARPGDEFVLYGPIQESLRTLGLKRRNIRHAGKPGDVAGLDLTDFDGFLFTSLFESMPNIVLEMSQHALPMILADVGGLRETFAEEGMAFFVSHRPTLDDTVAAFNAALDRAAQLQPQALAKTVMRARDATAARHSPAAYHGQIESIFGRDHANFGGFAAE